MVKLILIFIFVVLLITTIVIQFKTLGGFDTNIISSINVNIMVGLIVLIATVSFIDLLLEKHENNRKLKRYKGLVGRSHRQYVTFLKNSFLNFVTKSPNAIDFERVLSGIDEYIKQDFISRNIVITQIDLNDIFTPKLVEMNYFDYCSNYKKKVSEATTEYLNRYAAVIPPVVMTHILNIDDLLKSYILSSPSDYQVKIPLSTDNVKFDPDDFREVFMNIGKEILCLDKYSPPFPGSENTDKENKSLT